MPLNRFKGKELPDIPGFSVDPEDILTRLIAQYEQAYKDENGVHITLAIGSKMRIWLYTIALQQYLLESLVRFYASQNYLAYGTGEYLDHIAATRGGPPRAAAAKAVVTMRFTFSDPLPQPYVIPAGVRVTGNGSVYFTIEEACTIEVGAASWEHVFICQTAGLSGNGFLAGQINTLVDPLPYVQSVINLDVSQGGAEVQGDDPYAELVYLAPEGFAVAGPQLAYEYLAKSFSTTIMDVKAYQSAPGEVTVVPLMQGGEVPQPAFLAELLAFLSDKERRPLTDFVKTAAPTVIHFEVKFTWYMEAATGNQQEIQSKVLQAVADYTSWQKGRMGRDVNPQELIRRVLGAGAKRLVVVSPIYTEVQAQGVALAETPIVTFGGIENA